MKRFISKVKKTCKDFFTNKSAFSLVELIVVIAIMAVMAAVLAPSLLGYVEKSRMQKDDSAMSEVTNAIQLSLADMNIYDECLTAAVKDNYSCYADGDASTNIDTNKIITKNPELWLYNDSCRLLDETIYKPAGKMRGVTITFKPDGNYTYVLSDGIINQIGNDATKRGSQAGKTLGDVDFECLYNRLRSVIGDELKVSSQTYRNSDYTIFISMGTTGGNQAENQDAIQVYGQYNGTNLHQVASASQIISGSQAKPTIDIDLDSVDTNLQSATWAEIKQIAQAGQVETVGWKVGDTKTFSYNGSNYTATIVGIGQDDLNTITFMFTTPIRMPMNLATEGDISNPHGTNEGGFAASYANTQLNDVVYSNLEDDLKRAIKTVYKTSNLGEGKPNQTASSAYKLFLPSAKEVGFDSNAFNGYPYVDGVNNESDFTYTYFTSDGLSKRQALATSVEAWWLRTSMSLDGYRSTFFVVYTDGSLNNYYANLSMGMYPMFVVG